MVLRHASHVHLEPFQGLRASRVRAVNQDTIPWEDNLSARSALRTASPRQAATRRIARVMVSQLPCIPLNILMFLMSFLYT
jgi:hypothetical protein